MSPCITISLAGGVSVRVAVPSTQIGTSEERKREEENGIEWKKESIQISVLFDRKTFLP